MENLQNILHIDDNAKIKFAKKGEIIQRAGDLASFSYYIKKGLLRGYIIDSKGKEHIFIFAPEGWIIADIEALEFNQPAELYIDCLEDSEIVVFKSDSVRMADRSKKMIITNFELLYRRLGVLQRRIIMQMSSPALDRYEYFLKTYPELPNRVPQHMIASYLGITPQALSTIRSNITKNS